MRKLNIITLFGLELFSFPTYPYCLHPLLHCCPAYPLEITVPPERGQRRKGLHCHTRDAGCLGGDAGATPQLPSSLPHREGSLQYIHRSYFLTLKVHQLEIPLSHASLKKGLSSGFPAFSLLFPNPYLSRTGHF